ncbi:LPS export ABC transporter permease LptF [Thalassovita mediterranea]|jgi:lipopolysaccharide export system permease protein|uniref:Lipopolysaccharide ABC transporter permease n=1 Tax=Thalassovita mediterranea TaxID=340021 RepID=A0A0P1H0H8_9RHOB|nr:LPS export ABC transporter permease LptF [Thalassovita mediterranea]CUH83228.1 lipopolysaccharide ABC transporter permease [Thalassovita mediterranea]SIS33561.1 lipopolysaccharide export system permease protein [Thalassovita mediterranea]
MLSQLMVLFGFFALVLVSIYWINSAVRLFDRLIGDGQSALVFLEFTALTLPNVIRLVLPMSVFAGAVYVTNRLSNESELVVMQATGFSPWRLARPVVYYGLIVGVLMSLLTHILVPISLGQMREREDEISRNVTARLLTEGTFLHPSKGITFYIREIDLDGTLNDVYLSDRRDPTRALSYTARQAYLIQDQGAVKLVMVDGLAQSFTPEDTRLFTTTFDDFAYDISSVLTPRRTRPADVRHRPTWDLLPGTGGIDRAVAETGVSRAYVIEQLHFRVNQAFLCLAAAMIGFSTLLLGQFSRFGVWRQIVGALVLLVIVKLVEGVATDAVRANAGLWPLVYAPSIAGLGMAAVILHIAARPRGRRRASAPAAEGAGA